MSKKTKCQHCWHTLSATELVQHVMCCYCAKSLPINLTLSVGEHGPFTGPVPPTQAKQIGNSVAQGFTDAVVAALAADRNLQVRGGSYGL